MRELIKHGERLFFEKIARYKQGLSTGKDKTGLENFPSLLAAGRRKAELEGPARTLGSFTFIGVGSHCKVHSNKKC